MPARLPLLHPGRDMTTWIPGRRMPPAVRAAFDVELSTARTATDPATAWRAAERAHILFQPWP